MRQPEWQRGRKSIGLGLLTAAALAFLAGTATAADRDRPGLEYNRDIRPILAENCFACHGPDSAARKADLRLDRREVAVEAGAIVPGEPESSELIARINAKDPKELMPPPKTTKTLTARAEGDAAAMDRRGGRVSAALVADPPEAAGPAEGQGRVVGPQPDRPLRAGEARGERPAPGPRGRPPDARPSPEPRPHRPAAGPRARRGVRQRPLARGLRGPGRPAARLAPMGRAPRPILARRRALCRHQRLSLRQLSRGVGLSRLGDRRVQPQPAVRPVHDRATGRRPAARPHARPAGRLGVQPLQRDDQRGGRHPRGVHGPLRPRPHRDDLAGLDGADRRLRGLPRPQVRPDHPARVLRAVGVLQQHDAADHGRQRQGHAADRLRAGRGGPPPLGGADRRAGGRPRQAGRPQGRRPGRTSTAGSPRRSPTSWSRRSPPRACGWPPTPAAGATAPEARFEAADAGDFEKDQAFSYGAWVKLPKPGHDRLRPRADG